MKILITGGAGYVGTTLIRELSVLHPHKELIIYDNFSGGNQFALSGLSHPQLSFVQADLLDNETLKKMLQGVGIVFHLAKVQNESHHYMEQVNHWGTVALTTAISETPSVQKVIYLSDSAVYGTGTINADSPLNPQTPFAHSIARAEAYLQTLPQNIELSIVRATNVFGKEVTMHFHSGLNKWVFQAHYNKLLKLNADGIHETSHIEVTKLANVLANLTVNKAQRAILNASEYVLSEMEIYQKLQSFIPSLEATFTSHHLRLTDHIVAQDPCFFDLYSGQNKDLDVALKDLLETLVGNSTQLANT